MTKAMLAAPLFLVYTLTGFAQKPLKPVHAAAKPKPAPIPVPPTVTPVSELTMVDSNGLFIVSSKNFSATFNKQSGYLQEFNSPTDSLRDDTAVIRPSVPAQSRLQLFSTSTSTVIAMVRTDYSLSGTPLLLHISYTLNSNGDLLVEQAEDIDSSMLAQDSTFKDTVSTQPGMYWILPAGYDVIADQQQKITSFAAIRNGHGLKFIADTSRFSINTTSDPQRGTILNIFAGSATPPFTVYHYLYKVTLIRRWP